MSCTRRTHLSILFGLVAGGTANAQATPPDFNTYKDPDKEKFLAAARILSVEQIGHGVTKPIKVSLELNGARHAGQIQAVDKPLPDFFPKSGPPVPMWDSWRFNIAAYKVDRLLDLRMSPVSVRRTYRGKPAAFTWWIDDVMFEEIDRIKQDAAPPDPENFARQLAVAKVFDELIFNIDRNLANLLITKNWRIALIDHSRTFTAHHGIRNEANLTRCSRTLLMRMKDLSAERVSAAAAPFLTKVEIAALIARRDLILDFFERETKTKGVENVLFS
jgi:hypothetical protein